MKFCSKCGKELMDEAIICPHCGCAAAPGAKAMVHSGEDRANIGLCILSALLPIFGFIYWPVKHREAPVKAKACGIAAIIGFVISMLVMLADM